MLSVKGCSVLKIEQHTCYLLSGLTTTIEVRKNLKKSVGKLNNYRIVIKSTFWNLIDITIYLLEHNYGDSSPLHIIYLTHLVIEKLDYFNILI